MLDIISEVNKYLLTKIAVYAPIIQNVFLNIGSEEIICRQDPSRAVETRYFDGRRAGALNFSYYTKSKDQKKARQQLDAIVNALDFSGLTTISDGLLVKIEAVALPAYVSKTEAGEHIFTASMKLEYIN